MQFAVEQAREEGAARDRLQCALRSAISFFTSHPHYLRMHLREGHAWCMPEAVGARTREGAESWVDGVGAMIDLIDEGMREGSFRTDDARRTGKAVVMLQQLHLADWIEGGERDFPDAIYERYWADAEALLGVGGTAAADEAS